MAMNAKQEKRPLTDEERAECGRVVRAWKTFKEAERAAGRV